MGNVQHAQTKSVFTFQPTKFLVFTTVKSARLGLTCWIFLLRTKKGQLCCLVVKALIALRKKRVVTTKKENHLHFWRWFSNNHNQAHTNLNQRRQKSFRSWHSRVNSPMVDTVNQNFNFILIFYTFSLQWSKMILSVSNDGFEWSPNFGPDSVTLTVKVVVSKMKLLKELSNASSKYLQPWRNNGEEGRNAIKVRRTRYGHQRVSSVWFGQRRSLKRKWSAGCRRCL